MESHRDPKILPAVNQPSEQQTTRSGQEKQARHLQQVFALFDVTPSEKHHRGPYHGPKGPTRPALQLADAEATRFEFFDERRKDGEVKGRKEPQVRSQTARESEADEHRQRNAEREREGRKNRRGNAQFVDDVAQSSATHQPNRKNTKGNDEYSVDTLYVVERDGAMQLAISGENSEKAV